MRLTPTEWHLLEVLVRHRGRLVGRRQLLQEVWGPAYSTETNYLRVYLAQLRRKLEPDPARPRHLITEPGVGYRFEVEDEAGTGPRGAAKVWLLHPEQQSNSEPRPCATPAACTRLRTSKLYINRVTCTLTVFGLMNSLIDLLIRPTLHDQPQDSDLALTLGQQSPCRLACWSGLRGRGVAVEPA